MYRGYIRITGSILGLYKDSGIEDRNCYLGFSLGLRV